MRRIDYPASVDPRRYGLIHQRENAVKLTEPTEAEHQQAVVEYCALKHIPIFHIPNGGTRHVREAVSLKRQGVVAGVPDLCIPLARDGRHGLYIEMKRNAKSTVTVEQRKWLNRLNEEGYLAVICCGADEAISQIVSYVDQANRKVADEMMYRCRSDAQQENA